MTADPGVWSPMSFPAPPQPALSRYTRRYAPRWEGAPMSWRRSTTSSARTHQLGTVTVSGLHGRSSTPRADARRVQPCCGAPGGAPMPEQRAEPPSANTALAQIVGSRWRIIRLIPQAGWQLVAAGLLLNGALAACPVIFVVATSVLLGKVPV